MTAHHVGQTFGWGGAYPASMRAVVGVTDGAWAAYLRDRPHLAEANFWLPSGMGFNAITSGEPFLFKTHWPDNRIVGGGFLSGFTRLKVSEAWEIFGEGNGVGSPFNLLERIRHYRREKHLDAAEPDTVIGCILLRNLFFAAPGQELGGPPDFGKPIVTWKKYDLEAPSGHYVAEAFRSMQTNARIDIAWSDSDLTLAVGGLTRGLPRLVTPRVGQGAFKGLLLTSYHRRCAITGGRIRPTLEAAHIRPVAHEGEHRVDNGLLLRSDVHTLFDSGYLGVDHRHRLRVSPRLRSEWGNGQEFYNLASQSIDIPDRRADRPSREAIEWHMDEVFLSA